MTNQVNARHNDSSLSIRVNVIFVILIIIIAYWFIRTSTSNTWQFLAWEAFVPLFPFAVAYILVGRTKRWEEFLGSGQLLPWAITVAAISIRRISVNGLPSGFLLLGIMVFCGSSIAFGVAAYDNTRNAQRSEVHRRRIVYMAWASILIAVLTLVAGVYVAINSAQM